MVCVAAAVLSVGCGGGGGPSTFTVVYATDWTHFAAANGGQSEQITLYDANDLVLGTTVMNEDVAGVETFTFSSVPRGSQRFVIQLYSGRNLTGTQTGALEAVVTVERTTTFATIVGVAPTQIAVTPPVAVLTVPQNARFIGTAYASPNLAAFLPVGDLTWSATGGVVTVDAVTGTAVSTAPGPGTVKAVSSAYLLTGTAQVTVQAGSSKVAKWTVMVYLNAANDLSPYSTLNVSQMESVAQNPDVRIVLQWKEATGVSPSQVFNGTRRMVVHSGSTALIQDLGSGVDMGVPQTLKNFISWTTTNYPATRYALIVWNHGNGWRRSPSQLAASRAVSYDDETGNAIQVWDLPGALAGNHFDMIAWDASLMQMLEVAYEIRSFTTYVVGSEESPPGAGYPYDKILAKFRDNPDASSATLSKAFVDGMLGVVAYQNQKITQSVLETDKLDALATSVDDLAVQLLANQSDLTGVIPAVRTATQSYSPEFSPPRYYLDLENLAANMNTMIGISAIQTAAQNVETAASAAVLWEGHNSLSPGSHGVSIDFTPGSLGSSLLADYGQLEFAQKTHWGDWLNVSP